MHDRTRIDFLSSNNRRARCPAPRRLSRASPPPGSVTTRARSATKPTTTATARSTKVSPSAATRPRAPPPRSVTAATTTATRSSTTPRAAASVQHVPRSVRTHARDLRRLRQRLRRHRRRRHRADPLWFSARPNCLGQKTCPPQPVAFAGGCVPGGATYGPCMNNPQAEVCDLLDNDCNGIINNGVPPTPCDIPNAPPGIIYQDTFPASQCKRGQLPCNGTCAGWVGPSPEVCDGIDNDCDGAVDDNLPGSASHAAPTPVVAREGRPRALAARSCAPAERRRSPRSVTASTTIATGPRTTARSTTRPAVPAAGTGPADLREPICIYSNFRWCPPPGATCNDRGTLAAPCAPGALACDGVNGWTCQRPDAARARGLRRRSTTTATGS